MDGIREVPPAPRAGDPPTQMLGPEWDKVALTKRVAELEGQVAALVAAMDLASSLDCFDLSWLTEEQKQYFAQTRANLYTATEAHERRITEPLRARVEQLEAALREAGACSRCGGKGRATFGAHNPPLVEDPCANCAGDGLRSKARAALATPPGEWLADQLAAAERKGELAALKFIVSEKADSVGVLQRVVELEEEQPSLSAPDARMEKLLAAAKAEGAREAYNEIRRQAEEVGGESGIAAKMARLVAAECVEKAEAARKEQGDD